MQISDMLTGYARVSTDDQDLRLQKAALKGAGCRRIFGEKVSGAKRDRPELARMLDQLRDKDVVIVTRLDRLARSTKYLLEIAEQLNRCRGRNALASRALGGHYVPSWPDGADSVRRH